MAAIYAYSLIRAIPDRRRGEWANVGVCVYLPDRLDIRLHTNPSKLRALNPAQAMDFFDTLPRLWERLTDSMGSVEDRQALLARMPQIHASPLAAFTCAPLDYEAELAALMADLVVPPAMPSRPKSEPRLVTTLKRHFESAKLLGSEPEDINRHRVVSRFPIDASANLYADFALKNGKLRVTETLDFRIKNLIDRRGEKFKQAAVKAVTLNTASRIHEGVPSVVYAVGKCDRDRELIQPSLNLLSSYAERLYDANSKQDMAAYMDMMQAAANAS